jgi:HK97 family phage major capsid protein
METNRRVFDLQARGQAADEFDVSLASEHPVDRGGYVEVLDLTADAVDLTRAREGLPLLADHGQRRLGRITGLRVQAGKLRGRLKFFDTEAGREARAEVDGGHREVSIGYQVLATRDESDGRDRKVRVTRWRPYEGSIVAVPADPTVGINRSHQGASTMEEINTGADTGADLELSRAQRRAAGRAAAEGQERIDKLTRTAQAYAKWLRPDDVAIAVREGWSTDKFNDLIMQRMQSGAVDMTTTYPSSQERSHRDDDPAQGFSVLRALQALIDPAAFLRSAGREAEVSRELARASKLDTQGVIIPWGALSRGDPLVERQQRAMSAGSSGLGGSFVQTTIMGDQLIDALRARMVCATLGATMLPGLSSPVTLPRKSSSTSPGAWLTETGQATETDVATGGVTLTPRRVSAYVDVSKQLLITAGVAVEQMIVNDLRVTMSHEADRVAINGTGSSNEPRGVANVSGVGSVVGGTDGAQLDWTHVLALEAAVDDANAMTDPRTAAYAINAKTRSWLKRRPKISGASEGLVMGDAPIDDLGLGRLNGYPAMVSSRLPSNLVKGGSGAVCSRLVFGCWSELVIGMFGPGVELTVDPYTLARTGQVRIVASLFMDVGVRNAAAFAVMDDARTA